MIEIKNRKDVIEFVEQIEINLPVENWTINNVHVWPIFKINLLFFLLKQINNSYNPPAKKHLSNDKVSFKFLANNFKSTIKYFLWLQKLKKKQNIFWGHSATNSLNDNKAFNRFFDPIIIENKLQMEAIIIEYGPHFNKPYYSEKLHLDFFSNGIYLFEAKENFISFFSFLKKKRKNNLILFDQFESILNNNPISKDFLKNELNLEKLEHFIFKYSKLFNSLLFRIVPKNIFVVTYYNNLYSFLLTAIAQKKGVNIIELQHGPISEIHFAYFNWLKIPVSGYNCIPNYFWCWDSFSKKTIEFGIGNSNSVKAFIGGNIWIDYMKSKIEKLNISNYILYSLQTDFVTYDEMFSAPIINIIKKSKKTWFLKLHPREFENKNKLIELIKKHSLSGFVNIDDANKVNLPTLLFYCDVHVTISSGSTIEADLMGKQTILFSEIGVKHFSHVIEKKMAIYCNPKDSNFEQDFMEKIENLKSSDTKYYNKTELDTKNLFFKNSKTK